MKMTLTARAKNDEIDVVVQFGECEDAREAIRLFEQMLSCPPDFEITKVWRREES